jgi:predicted permease
VLKLLVMPAVAWPIAWVFGLGKVQLQVAVLESAMPTMTTVVALTASYRLAPRLAVSLVSYTLLLSLVTLPVWTWVIS